MGGEERRGEGGGDSHVGRVDGECTVGGTMYDGRTR